MGLLGLKERLRVLQIQSHAQVEYSNDSYQCE